MDKRTLGGISACVAYALWIATWWAIILLAQIPSACDIAFLAMLPLLIPILLADYTFSFLPTSISEFGADNGTVSFAVLIAVTFFALYWIGWWIEALKETSDPRPSTSASTT